MTLRGIDRLHQVHEIDEFLVSIQENLVRGHLGQQVDNLLDFGVLQDVFDLGGLAVRIVQLSVVELLGRLHDRHVHDLRPGVALRNGVDLFAVAHHARIERRVGGNELQ